MLDNQEHSMERFVTPEISLPWFMTSQRQYELDCLISVFKELNPTNVLEIGSQEGGTLYQWMKHIRKGGKVVNIDIFQNQPPDHGLAERWLSWRREDTEFVSIIGRSQEVWAQEMVKKEFPDGIDFIFIDGDHTYDGAKSDFVNYGSMVRKGGVIAFHDLMTPKNGIQNHIQVGRLWKEIQHCGYATIEYWCHPDPDWGGIGVMNV